MSHPSLPSLPSVEGSAFLRTQLAIETTIDASDSDLLHIRASDQTLDRYKEVIVASGWRLDNYLRNPVIQNAHQYGDIIFTIGRAEKTWVNGNALLQTWRFASNENPFAKIARDLYRGKFLQAASVGFIPLKWEDGEGDLERGVHAASPSSMAGTLVPRRRYLEQELLEVSAVGIPANPNALTLALRAGAVEKSDARELYDLLSHLVGTARCAVRSASPFVVQPLGCPDSAPPLTPFAPVQEPPAFASLLPQLRSLLSTLNRKENS